ncbi:MAG: hypothetical protein AAF412_02070, partial [Pseudomonadota bacterium]
MSRARILIWSASFAVAAFLLALYYPVEATLAGRTATAMGVLALACGAFGAVFMFARARENDKINDELAHSRQAAFPRCRLTTSAACMSANALMHAAAG